MTTSPRSLRFLGSFRTFGVGTALGASVLFGPGAIEAQQGQAGAAVRPAARADSVDLVFEREVFIYPSYTRRNPFRPLTSGADAGPRFEELVLIGVIYSSEPDASVALLSVGLPGSATQALRTHRVRPGTVIGNMRVLEVQRDRVVIEVEEFGNREQRVLELRRGGTQGGGESFPEPPPDDEVQAAPGGAQGDPE